MFSSDLLAGLSTAVPAQPCVQHACLDCGKMLRTPLLPARSPRVRARQRAYRRDRHWAAASRGRVLIRSGWKRSTGTEVHNRPLCFLDRNPPMPGDAPAVQIGFVLLGERIWATPG